MTFDITRFIDMPRIDDQYDRQLRRLRAADHAVDCIEAAVSGCMRNLTEGTRQSFVVYGEPQSGKTEMMICLTAKLLDSGRNFILHLLNDSVDLLGQNLGRFQQSGLAPSARNYTEILDPQIKIEGRPHVIFCKKNARDLQKLFDRIAAFPNLIVIDDEADFASPNAEINKQEQTRINELITSLLGTTGDYIGVTATPARLDLNNTFDNDNHRWINFPPHNLYTGQDVFFPLEMGDKINFRLTLLPTQGDEPKHLRDSVFGFMVNVGYLNISGATHDENYSMLIHTSGKKVDHKADWDVVNNILTTLSDSSSRRYPDYVRSLWERANARYHDINANEIVHYILTNITRNAVFILNSDRDFIQFGKSATSPTALFTIIIGGNIVSRGVTFDNLLSMYFTRDVRHKIQQDTYIQRARMFGARGTYLRFFELTIPAALYADWHRCFVFHKLALDAIKEGMGSPVWLSDRRISAVASSSIDKSTVDLDRGEMAFQLFPYDEQLDSIPMGHDRSTSEKLDALSDFLGDAAFPSYLRRFIVRTSPRIEKALAIHASSSIEGYKPEPGLNKDAIERRRGFFGTNQMEKSKYPDALHHLKIFRNARGMARLFYKFDGSIQFLKNLRQL